MKKLIVDVVLLMSLNLFGNSVRENYLRKCNETASMAFCVCTFNLMINNLTVNQFEGLLYRFSMNQQNNADMNFLRVVTNQCSHLY